MLPKKKSLFRLVFSLLIFLFTAMIVIHASNAYDAAKQEEARLIIEDGAGSRNLDYFKLTNDFTKRIKETFLRPEYSETTGKFVAAYTALFVFILLYLQSTRHNLLSGREHGSAMWSSSKILKKLKDKDASQNMLFTMSECMSMNGYKTKKNNNTLIIGGSGTGKTQSYLIPNLLQMHSSFVVTDPKGEILRNCGKVLKDNGYKISVLNLWELENSNCYNPFVYLRPGRDEDVMTLINTLMMNTDGDKRGNSSDPFWEKAEQLFLQAIFYYIIYELPPEERHIPMALELIRCAEVREDEADYESDLDIMFKLLEEEKGPGHIAAVQYKHFKVAAGKTAKSIIISASARLSPFNIPGLSAISKSDELELSTIGEKKTALFVIIPSTNPTYNFVASIMYTQLFAELDYVANFKYKGSLPVKVRFLLDEFANIGKLPRFEIILAYARSLGVGITPIFQSLSQLKEMYKDSWETIMDCCDSFLFLGSQGAGTTEYVSKKLGKATIETKTTARTFSKQGSSSENYNITGRELMTADELTSDMDDEHCILFIRGLRPFYSKKYNPLLHPNFRYTRRADVNNEFVFMRETVHRERDLDAESNLMSDTKEGESKVLEAIDDIRQSIDEDLSNIRVITNSDELPGIENIELLEDEYYEEEDDEPDNEVEEAVEGLLDIRLGMGTDDFHVFSLEDDEDMEKLAEKLQNMELLEDEFYEEDDEELLYAENF